MNESCPIRIGTGFEEQIPIVAAYPDNYQSESAFRCVAVCCGVLQHHSVIQCAAVCCTIISPSRPSGVLQCVVVCCSTTVCCSVLHNYQSESAFRCVAMCCCVLQRCRVLQYVAQLLVRVCLQVCCSVLWCIMNDLCHTCECVMSRIESRFRVAFHIWMRVSHHWGEQYLFSHTWMHHVTHARSQCTHQSIQTKGTNGTQKRTLNESRLTCKCVLSHI